MGKAVESVDLEPIVNQDGDLRDNIVTAAIMVLSDVQDFVAESMTSPWPSASDGAVLPCPDAEWDGDSLTLFFGRPDAPALALQPILLDGADA